jgi:hypothetical protein
VDRRELVRKYKETPRPAGVYRIQHTASGRTLLGSSPDAPAMLNRIRAELRMRGHRHAQLQRDWESDGAEAFVFEVLDLLPDPEGSDYDVTQDLRTLTELWSDKLQLGDNVY